MERETAKQIAKQIVGFIVRDVADRRGLRQEWEQIDDDVRREIRKHWEGLVTAVLADTAPPAAPRPEATTAPRASRRELLDVAYATAAVLLDCEHEHAWDDGWCPSCGALRMVRADGSGLVRWVPAAAGRALALSVSKSTPPAPAPSPTRCACALPGPGDDLDPMLRFQRADRCASQQSATRRENGVCMCTCHRPGATE